jgi:2-hydroxychromene-2-carboxylate isomerase
MKPATAFYFDVASPAAYLAWRNMVDFLKEALQ